jgi:type II secretion system protein G
MKLTHDKRGFTLIELLVVIAIISVLSATIIASLNGARSKARDAKRLSEIRQIRTALELYSSSNGFKYPQGNGCTDGNVCNLSNLQTVLAPYLKSIPVDPLGGGFVQYQYVRGSDSSYGLYVRFEKDGLYCKTGQNVDLSWWSNSTPLCRF